MNEKYFFRKEWVGKGLNAGSHRTGKTGDFRKVLRREHDKDKISDMDRKKNKTI